MRRLAALLIAAMANSAGAQWNREIPAFAGGAVLVGAQGFARPPLTSAVVSAYAHVPAGIVLVGVQGGRTFDEPRGARATYAVTTLAYAQRTGIEWQVYPFVGAGVADFRTTPSDVDWRPAFAAGFGIDVRTGGRGIGPMLAARIGYITRSISDDESVAYAALGVGFGGRRESATAPRSVARVSP